MTGPLAEKHAALRGIIRGMNSVLVAYSGGVDSALVLAIAHQELRDRALACIGVSPSYPQRELRAGIALAESLGARYRLIDTTEQHDPKYLANAGDRCYFCKVNLYAHMQSIAARECWKTIAGGVHGDDVEDHVHGIRAARSTHVRFPLLEAGLVKDEVRALARSLDLPVWDKPATACLASRIPAGTPITIELLRQIEKAEDALADLGFVQFRVRHHGKLARIELPAEDLPRAVKLHQIIVSRLRDAGYRFVTLDLAGFRGGDAGEQIVSLTVHTAG